MTTVVVLATSHPNLVWYVALVVLTAAMAAGSVWMLRVWNDVKGETVETSDDPDELLRPLAEAFASGQMSEEEYQRIKRSIGRGSDAGRAPPAGPKPGRGAGSTEARP